MKGIHNIIDHVLLAIGILLLSFLWFSFPETPVAGEQYYANYYPSEVKTNSKSKWSYLSPSKSLSPRDVIQIQFKALKENDKGDSGVITVFNFSSPISRVSIGPINNFRLKVRDPAYSPMLNFSSYRTGHLIVTGNTAYQVAVIDNATGQSTAYMFMLAKQKKGIYKDCWMTVGIVRLDDNKTTYAI